LDNGIHSAINSLLLRLFLMFSFLLVIYLLFYVGFSSSETVQINTEQISQKITIDTTSIKTIHIFVALCDNTYQGIVPVPPKIGNGQDPGNNLYWGCGYGVRTYFKKSAEWKLIQTLKPDTLLMERLVFKHLTKNYYLIADAYNGKYIKECTVDYLNSCAGKKKDFIKVNATSLGIYGNSKLLGYTGHDGLMDFSLEQSFKNTDGKKRDAIILACYSKSYFSSYLEQTGAAPLLWTTGLMCPEAYTIHDAITGYVNNESNESIRTRGAKAYTKYHKCGEKAAKNLLVTGK